jgi:hypothetical protein
MVDSSSDWQLSSAATFAKKMEFHYEQSLGSWFCFCCVQIWQKNTTVSYACYTTTEKFRSGW